MEFTGGSSPTVLVGSCAPHLVGLAVKRHMRERSRAERGMQELIRIFIRRAMHVVVSGARRSTERLNGSIVVLKIAYKYKGCNIGLFMCRFLYNNSFFLLSNMWMLKPS